MSKIDKDKSYVVEIDKDSLKNGGPTKMDSMLTDLIKSMTNYLVNGTADTPVKYLVFTKKKTFHNYFYSSICIDWDDVYVSMNHILNKDLDAESFLVMVMDTTMLPKKEAMKVIENMFYESFRGNTGLNELIMFDLTTKIFTRDRTGEFKEYIQG